MHVRFAAVAEAGVVTRAAAQLKTVQLNVTARLHALERDLGVPLFNRHSRGMSLTAAAGMHLQPYATKILALLDEARNAVSDSGEPKGILRLGSTETTAAVRMPSCIPSSTMTGGGNDASKPEQQVLSRLCCSGTRRESLDDRPARRRAVDRRSYRDRRGGASCRSAAQSLFQAQCRHGLQTRRQGRAAWWVCRRLSECGNAWLHLCGISNPHSRRSSRGVDCVHAGLAMQSCTS
jgi:hypothetical protein